MKRLFAYISCMLLLFFAVSAPVVRAADSVPTERPALVDFDQTLQGDALLQNGPVVEDPGEAPGAGIPGDSSTLIAILAAAAGGFVLGLFVGVIGCCMMYYFSLY